MQLLVNKQQNFRSFHNFQYETKGVRVWKDYSIGKGKLASYEEIFDTYQGPTSMAIADNQTFFPVSTVRGKKLTQARLLLISEKPVIKVVKEYFQEKIFSRLAAKRRKETFAASGESGSNTTSSTESDIEELLEESETVQEILDEISVQSLHPIIYDSFDLCEYNKKQQFARFSVSMLRIVCNHFEIVIKSRDTKTVLLTKLKEVVNQCSCVLK